MIEHFYHGLKDEVKDEINKILDTPMELGKYMDLAVRIDNQLYQQRLEKRQKTPYSRGYSKKREANTGKQRNSNTS